MEFELVECVGKLPWAGFVLGCIALAAAIIFGVQKLYGIFLQWLYCSDWWINWRKERSLKRLYKHANKKPLTCKQLQRRLKIGKLIVKSLTVLAYMALGTLGCWMIWGFIKVIICLSN